MTFSGSSRLGLTEDWGETPTIKFGAKTKSDYATSNTLLFYSESFTRDDTDAADIFYQATLSLNTDEFIAAFSGATTLGIIIEIELDGDTVAQRDAKGIWDVIRGGEGAVTPAVPPLPTAPTANTLLGSNADGTAWVQLTPAQVIARLGLLALTGLTGGSANDLDGIATADGEVDSQTIREVLTGSVGGGDLAITRWVLMPGTNAEDGISYVRPDDYHATTNARVWVRIG
jgi:hypothetical protein